MSATASPRERTDDAEEPPCDGRSSPPRTTSVGGASVAYAEYGDRRGEPLVVLHGTPGSRLLGGLYHGPARDAGVRVLSVDRPGYGRSDPRDDYSPADAPSLVAAVLDDAGVKSAGVAAFSGGAPHALATAAGLPERVRGVDVVAGGVPGPERDETPPPLRLLGALAARAPRLLGGLLRGQAWLARRRPPAFVTAQYTASDRGDPVPDDVAAAVKRDFLEALSRSRSGVVREAARSADDWEDALFAVDCPVRWWHGERDDNVALAAAERTADRLPDCELRRVDADHLGALVATRAAVCERYGRA
ncbi:alpha/beta fold hydrolase [Halobacterium yunchengense]|uniref:alpha/beta fold hydrolase n=1 Tax=Halobacterium yunchengense TaxID=3108497 RepID=UPI003009EF06